MQKLYAAVTVHDESCEYQVVLRLYGLEHPERLAPVVPLVVSDDATLVARYIDDTELRVAEFPSFNTLTGLQTFSSINAFQFSIDSQLLCILLGDSSINFYAIRKVRTSVATV